LRTFAATNSEHAVIFSICDLVNDDRDQLLSFDLQSMNIIYIPNDGLRDLLGVQGTPFAGLIDPAGRVRSAGVVNSLQHLESLISVEEYVFVGDSAHAHPAPVIGNTAGADDQ
jgi:hypothetical protein